MNTPPYTLQQAEQICKQYQHLVGALLDAGKGWTIDCVVVAPADILNQWLFAHCYIEYGCPREALKFYKRDAYNVIALSVYNRKLEAVAFKDVHSYLVCQPS